MKYYKRKYEDDDDTIYTEEEALALEENEYRESCSLYDFVAERDNDEILDKIKEMGCYEELCQLFIPDYERSIKNDAEENFYDDWEEVVLKKYKRKSN